MDKIVEKYKRTVEAALRNHEHVFLDNVYPKPVDFLAKIEPGYSDPSYLTANTDLVDFWKEVLSTAGERILMPWEICRQAYQGYGRLTCIVAQRKKAGTLSEALETAAYKYLQQLFILLQETRHHLFTYPAQDTVDYQRCLESFQALVEHLEAKGPGHKDDQGADETVAASAIFRSKQVGKVSGIITYDYGLENLIVLYSELHLKNTSPAAPIGKAKVYLPPNMSCYSPHLEPELWQQDGARLSPRGTLRISSSTTRTKVIT